MAEGFPIALALDKSEAAIRTHRRNFPTTASIACDLAEIGPKGVLKLLRARVPDGTRIGVIGGPPCQGFSRANTGSRSDDPRNELAVLYVDVVAHVARYFEVEFVLFENVLGIRDAKHQNTFGGILQQFEDLGFYSEDRLFNAVDFGVPQTRKRVIITAFRSQVSLEAFHPTTTKAVAQTVRSAIGGLPEPRYFARGIDVTTNPHHENHWTMQPKSRRFSDPDSNTAPGRAFRRLDWEQPSPTVAYGHREIHVHPEGHRRLSIYEAMKLQGFPDEFVLEGNLSEQVEQISNAVPPPMARAVARATREAIAAVAERGNAGASAN